MIRKSILDLAHLIEERELSASELADQYLMQIREHNQHYQAISMVSEASVRILAEKADRDIAEGKQTGPLHGIPILIDDLIDVANIRTTYGSQAFSENLPEVDSLAVRKLRAEGAIILGKAATSEFGLLENESDEKFISRSPWGDGIVSGSGSSGVAVGTAMNFAVAGIGMDVGGNVALPGAFSGVFVMQPSRGRVAHTPAFSRGLMFADPVIVANDVTDCALMMNVVSGESEVDPLGVKYRDQDFVRALKRPVRSLKVAYINALWNAQYEDDCQAAVADSINLLHTEGYRIEQSRPPVANVIDSWKTIYSANLYADYGEDFRKNHEKFGDTAMEWFTQGEDASTSDFIDAQKRILGFRRLLTNFFNDHDVLITTATGCVPFRYGCPPFSTDTGSVSGTRGYEYASMCMVGALSGFPTGVVPVNKTEDGVPVAVQVIALPGNDDLVLSVCAQLMQ